MELVSNRLHTVLTYVAAVNRKGARLSLEQLESFAFSPKPRGAVTRNPFAEVALRGLSSYVEQVQPAETTCAFLARVEWIEVQDDGVRLTALGRAVLEEADRPVLADPADEPLSVTIDPDDPLAYARIFHLISGHGDGMLVDPYLKFEGLIDVIEISGIDRVLTSNDNTRKRLSIFGRVLGASSAPPVMKTLDRTLLHDRFFIPDEGPVYSLGSSLNSIAKRPGVVTPIADTAAAKAIRAAYSKLWRQGVRVAASQETADSSS